MLVLSATNVAVALGMPELLNAVVTLNMLTGRTLPGTENATRINTLLKKNTDLQARQKNQDGWTCGDMALDCKQLRSREGSRLLTDINTHLKDVGTLQAAMRR
jgi:hypothetical protein